jgi:hypothetical protein
MHPNARFASLAGLAASATFTTTTSASAYGRRLHSGPHMTSHAPRKAHVRSHAYRSFHPHHARSRYCWHPCCIRQPYAVFVPRRSPRNAVFR